MTYTTAAQDAKAIRETLKATLGLTARDVSVRARTFSMGSSITVRLRNTDRANATALALVKDVAAVKERIDRCKITGEILSGGNRYVEVTRDADALVAIGAPYVDAVADAMAKVERGSSALHRVGETDLLIGWDATYHALQIRSRSVGTGSLCRIFDRVEQATATVAEWILAQAVGAER